MKLEHHPPGKQLVKGCPAVRVPKAGPRQAIYFVLLSILDAVRKSQPWGEREEERETLIVKILDPLSSSHLSN